jgi:tetratricopeptide (TPR) repeat protein
LVVKLTTTAFKGFPSKRRVTPPMDPGQASNTLTPELPRKVDDKLLAENVAALAKDGQNSRALALLRDSVDAAPFDAGRRRLLIEFLMTHGETGTAASEAQRAALLMPESGEFHVMAARALMQGGDSAQAQIELNEAVARDPESFETRLLLGELCLMKLDVANAIEHFNKALEKDSTPQALFERALAGALEGNKEAAAKDMADALKGGEDAQQVQIRYALMRNLADRALTDFGSRCSELVRKARLQPTAPDVLAGSKQLAATCDGIKQLVDLPTKPAANAASHDQLVLALNLLAQSLSQIDESLKDKDSDALADATATLGQALKQAAAARDAYKAELQKPAD